MHQDISSREGPSNSTETLLWQLAQAGCRQSLNQLMQQHDGLVHAVVRQQVLGDLPYEMALHAGRIGLWKAIQGYDPQRGTAFSTYAWTAIMRRIWGAVNRYRSPREAIPLCPRLADEAQEPSRGMEREMAFKPQSPPYRNGYSRSGKPGMVGMEGQLRRFAKSGLG